MTTTTSARRFQMWEYHVSHGRLLLRSPKSERVPTNLDIEFIGVEYLALPRHLVGLEVREASPAELDAFREVREVVAPDRLFTLTSEGLSHSVVAVSYRVTENDMDIFETRH